MHDLDRKRSSFADDDRAAAKIHRQRLNGQRRRHNNYAQFWPNRLLHQPHDAQGKIAFQTTLVKLIEKNNARRIEKGIVVQETNEDAWRHYEDARPRTAVTVESHMITDFVPEPSAAFIGHAPSSSTCRETSRFQEDNAPILGKTRFEESGRHVRRLTRTCRCAQHNARLLPKRRNNLRENRING
jgi:hypothetical protein